MFFVSALSLQYLLLKNSLKFFTFLVEPYSFRFASFVYNFPSLNDEIRKKMIFDYGQMLYNREVISLIFFIIFLLIVFFFIYRRKYRLINYLVTLLSLILIERLDLIKFNNPGISGLIPEKVFNDIGLYFMINGIVYFFLGSILIYVSFIMPNSFGRMKRRP